MTQQSSIDELRFSFNPKYQASYFKLRNDIMKKSYNLPEYDWGEDEYDNERDTVYVINKDDICIAGARLITRDKHKLLVEEFMDLQEHFNLPTKQDLDRVCELSRLVISKQYRSTSLLITILKKLAKHATKLNKNKIAYCSSQNNVRMIRSLVKRRLGYSSVMNNKLFYYGEREKMPVTSALALLQ